MHEPPEETTSTPTLASDTSPESPGSVTVATDAEFEVGVRTVMNVVALATRHAVARAALRAGIRILVQDPLQIVQLLRDGRSRLPEPTPPRKEVR
jgi:hypothetical protein